jgi:hypothetical protein
LSFDVKSPPIPLQKKCTVLESMDCFCQWMGL